VNLLLRADLYGRTAESLPGSFEQPDGTILSGSNPGYVRVDLAANYDLIHPVSAVHHAVIFVKIANLFNENYQDVPGFPAPGMNVLAGVRTTF